MHPANDLQFDKREEHMFGEEFGDYTLCEFEVIEHIKDFDDVDYANSNSDEPILLSARDVFSSFLPASSPCSPYSSPCTPRTPYSDCSSSPYSLLSPPLSHTSSRPQPRRGRILCAADLRPLRVLGRGGHGTVYLVEDTVSARPLALKVVEKNGLRLREYPAVFEEQAVARALGAGKGSPWFVPLVGSFEDSDNFYFLTEYFPRGDLMQEMRRNGGVSEHQARFWCAELLIALEHLHSRRIVHRDVKLDNMLLDEDGHIALADFGIARAFGDDSTDRPWTRVHPWDKRQLDKDGTNGKEQDGDETHSLVGTPGYTAPEVYSGKYSYGVDIWGAGVVLYCMLTGRLPFGLQPKEQRLEEVIARTDGVPADFDLLGVVDADVRDLLMKMLEKDPRKRPSIRKLKKHRWFRGTNWDAIERREPSKFTGELDFVDEEEEDIYISYGRAYGALDEPPHHWFEWVSPSLRGIEDSWDTMNEWSFGSTCYTHIDVNQNEDLIDTSIRNDPWQQRSVVQKMKGWLKRRRMSSS